jgi:hypothetical protein
VADSQMMCQEVEEMLSVKRFFFVVSQLKVQILTPDCAISSVGHNITSLSVVFMGTFNELRIFFSFFV